MISVYSDGCNAKGKTYHPIIMEPAHFCTTEVHGLDLMVTTTLYCEPQLRSAAALSAFQKDVKLQILNLAIDATFAWLHHAMKVGVEVQLNEGPSIRLYPRILAYDGDQPELVSIIGKTCYLCWAHADEYSRRFVVDWASMYQQICAR